MKNSFPPLLRGIGVAVMLMAAVTAFCIGRQHNQLQFARLNSYQSASGKKSGDSVAALVSEVQKLRAEVEQESLVEEVLENAWFEWLGFAGSAIFAASFFAEAYLRRDKKD
jgi:alcohol dehydrogenase class IV